MNQPFRPYASGISSCEQHCGINAKDEIFTLIWRYKTVAQTFNRCKWILHAVWASNKKLIHARLNSASENVELFLQGSLL